MPNWCTNQLSISHGSAAMMDRMRQAVAEERLFNAVIPVPKSLDITAGSLGDPEQQAHLEILEDANQSEHGYKNWYDFCVNEWGTKWEANGINVSTDDDHLLELTFETAWGPPLGIYNRLVEQGYEISAYYYEPGCAFVGHWDNGADNCYEIPSTSAEVRESIPDYLDDYFGISESMEQWENENVDQV